MTKSTQPGALATAGACLEQDGIAAQQDCTRQVAQVVLNRWCQHKRAAASICSAGTPGELERSNGHLWVAGRHASSTPKLCSYKQATLAGLHALAGRNLA